MNTTGTNTAGGAAGAGFSPTHWSVVLAAKDKSSPQSQQALETLCRTYWHPLYLFARRQGHSPDDAEDLTQEFFARLLQKDYLQTVAREKGRFRSFLLVALKRFLANEWDRAHARKRGGGQALVPLDTRLAERHYQTEPPAAASPDQLYERRWALTLLDRTVAGLRQEFEAAGKAGEFACLKEFLAADRGELDYGAAAARLGTSEGAARVAVHRLRRRFREVYRQQVAQTVSSPEEIEDEIRHLRAALSP